MASTSKINDKVGMTYAKILGTITRFIVENKDRKVDSKKKKGSGFPNFAIPSGLPLDSTGASSEVAPSESGPVLEAAESTPASKIVASGLESEVGASSGIKLDAVTLDENKLRQTINQEGTNSQSINSTQPPSAPSESSNINLPRLTREMMDTKHFTAPETTVPETTAPSVPAPPESARRLAPINGIKPNQILTLNTSVPLKPIPKEANLPLKLQNFKTWGPWGLGYPDPDIIQSDGVHTTSAEAPETIAPPELPAKKI
jgi:hypothetical protein